VIREQQLSYNALKYGLLIIMVLGMVMLYSASSRYSYYEYNDVNYVLIRYTQRLFAAIVFAVAFYMVDLKHWRVFNKYLFFGSLALIAFPFITKMANPDQYTARWIYIGSLSFQTAEIGRFALIIFTANYLAAQQKDLNDLQTGFLPYLAMASLILIPLALTPDYSSSAVLTVIFMIVLYVGGASLKHVVSLGAVAAVAGFIYVRMESYRWNRIVSFLHPDANADLDYQIRQSLMSLGNGGLFGRSLGGSFGKNMYLPESHTDFIFSVLGEEWGFIGSLATILLFALIFWALYRLSLHTRDIFSRTVIFATALSILVYALINAAVCSRLLPVTGLPMPFISYSGSQIVINGALMGIIFRIIREERA